MRFGEIRQTVTTRTGENATDLRATPRFLSPYLLDGRTARPGVNPLDVLQPRHNRVSRRRMGIVQPRHRIAGVALIEKPWHNTHSKASA